MKIAIAQMNCVLGDLSGNLDKIVQNAEQAKKQGAKLLLTPELSLCGYPPEDLLLRDGFYRACVAALLELANKISDIAVVVGHPHEEEGKRYNAASLLRDGEVVLTYLKHRLPNYAVFDEARYFQRGNRAEIFEIEGVNFGLAICADVWDSDVTLQAREAGAQVLLVLNASPYAVQKHDVRSKMIANRVSESGLSVIYANMVGGQDELVFDGGSFAMNAQGEVSAQAPHFQEALLMLGIEEDCSPRGEQSEPLNDDESIYQALCLGVRDYVTKNRFPGVLLGLSGGIDSALTLAVAVDALGADKVHAVMMPSPYTAQISLDDSREMANILGIRYDEFSIEPLFQGYLSTLEAKFSECEADATEENLQARIRATLLMALSNKFGSLVLTTSNKSEMSVGYATLYGDMAGGFSVLKDVSKMLVYRLARYRNTLGKVIPERIITRAPSAELRDNQTDQDNLPEYEVLDEIVACYVEKNLSILEIVARGFSEEDVRKVVQMTRSSEYKRRQSAVGVRITERGYGKDWRYPITVRYQDDY